jgi:ubiquinone/menaquinone biosynthesis C-methylase UbiE
MILYDFFFIHLKKIIPTEIRSILRKNAFVKFFLNYFPNKYYKQLRSQRRRLWLFKKNPDRVFEYWKNRNLDDIVKICGIGENKKVLDVGCGITTVLHFIKGIKFGIDPLAKEYSKLYNYPDDMNIREGHGENLPFTKNSFDIVICTHALDHTSCPKKTIDEIYRVLKIQGYFILIVEILKERMSARALRGTAHPYSLTKRDVDSLLGKKFEKIYEKVSPFSRNALNNSKALIMILKKNIRRK